MTTMDTETGADLFAEFFGLDRADFDDVAAVLPVVDPDPAPVMVAGCCSCGASIMRPLDGPRPACTHDGEQRPGGVVLRGTLVTLAGRGRCFNDRHDVGDDGYGVALYSAGNYVPQCAECVTERLGCTVNALPAGAPGYFPPPRPVRFDGAPHFAARGNVYRLRKATEGKGWEAVAVSAGLAGPVRGKTQADAVRAVWEAVEAHADVSEPHATTRDGRTREGFPRQRASVVGDLARLELIENPHKSRDPWAEACFRCNGEGWLVGYEHVHGGLCFRCNGDKVDGSYTLAEAACRVRREAREERAAIDRRALDAERKRLRWLRFTQAHRTAAVWLERADFHGDKFAGKLRGRVLAGHELSAGQVAACEKNAAEEYAEAYESAHAEAEQRARVRASRPAGAKGERVTVTGTVARTFGYTTGPDWRPKAGRGVVVDDGAGVSVVAFTTAAWAFELNAGDRVALTGDVKNPENRDRYTGEIQSKIGGRMTCTAAE